MFTSVALHCSVTGKLHGFLFFDLLTDIWVPSHVWLLDRALATDVLVPVFPWTSAPLWWAPTREGTSWSWAVHTFSFDHVAQVRDSPSIPCRCPPVVCVCEIYMLQEGFHLPKGDDVTFHPSVPAHRLQRVFSAAAGGRVGFKIVRRDGAELAYSLRKQGCPGEHQGPLEAAGVHRRQASLPQLETRKQVPEICVSSHSPAWGAGAGFFFQLEFFFFFLFYLEEHCFTVLYWLPLYNCPRQPQVHTSPLPPGCPWITAKESTVTSSEWMNLQPVSRAKEVWEREASSAAHTCLWTAETWDRWACLQGGTGDPGAEGGPVDTGRGARGETSLDITRTRGALGAVRSVFFKWVPFNRHGKEDYFVDLHVNMPSTVFFFSFQVASAFNFFHSSDFHVFGTSLFEKCRGSHQTCSRLILP